MQQRRCGRSGLTVSAVTLGLMVRDCRTPEGCAGVRRTLLRAVEKGVTSIDLATGYGGGTVEQAVGRILREDLPGRRDQLVLATKGGWADGSRRTLAGMLERSLRQLGVEYVDLYYHHAPDADTPLEETVAALDLLVRQGKTRYVGVSNYSPEETARFLLLAKPAGLPCVVHQANYNLLNRWVEDGLLAVLAAGGMSMAAFTVVAQGLLSEASLPGPRPASRAERTLQAMVESIPGGEPAYGRYEPGDVRGQILARTQALAAIARERGQTLAQLAVAWVLRDPRVATALVGMSSEAQADEAVAAVDKLELSPAERQRIARVLAPRWGVV